MARRFRRRAPFRRSRGRASPFAGPVSGGRGLEWYLLAFDCCGIGFTLTSFDINACANGSGWLFQNRTIFPTIVDGGILTIERIRGDFQIDLAVISNEATTAAVPWQPVMQTGLTGGGFIIPSFQCAIDVRSTIAGQRVSPQMWQIGDGESPTWMYRSLVTHIGEPVLQERANALAQSGISLTTRHSMDIDVKVKRRIDIGSHDLEFQYGMPVCAAVEGISSEDLLGLQFSISSRLHLRMLARTGPGN